MMIPDIHLGDLDDDEDHLNDDLDDFNDDYSLTYEYLWKDYTHAVYICIHRST